jgi:hypothetical protein
LDTALAAVSRSYSVCSPFVCSHHVRVCMCMYVCFLCWSPGPVRRKPRGHYSNLSCTPPSFPWSIRGMSSAACMLFIYLNQKLWTTNHI